MMNILTVHAESSDPPQLLVLILILNKVNQLVASLTKNLQFILFISFGFRACILVTLLVFCFWEVVCVHSNHAETLPGDHYSMNLSL